MINLYKIINKENNKVYIGQTKQTITARFSCHKTRSNLKTKEYLNNCLYLAMNKIGKEKFEPILLETVYNQKEADEKEKFYIKKYNSIYPNGYNTVGGGKITRDKSSQRFSNNVSNGRKKSEKIKRVRIYEYDYNLKLIKIWNSKQELLKTKGIFIPSKFENNMWLFSNKHFYLRNPIFLKKIKEKQIVQFDKNGKEIRFRYFNTEFEKEFGICNVSISSCLKGKVKKLDNGTFFFFRKDITKKKIQEIVAYKRNNAVKKIKCTLPNKQIIIFNSSTEAQKILGLNRQLIAKNCKRKTLYKNHFFEYIFD